MTLKIRNAVIERLDLQVYAGSLPSPCISVCSMNPQSGLCDGCLRTIDEIVQWGTASEQLKRAIWMEIKRRHKTMAESAE
jgi:predicted Fe-S protein YdhL (DUF1289 family)